MSGDRTSESGPLTYADWRDRLEDGELVGLECRSCGHVTATPKRACIDCGDRILDTCPLPTTGTVHSETTITVPPVGFEGPYQVSVIDLGETKLMGRIRSDEGVEIGASVEFVDTVELDGMPAPVFEPTG
ncbi:OB-fold domain-containing protein (plasmid) [Haladaptatus sp. SPP-AMP-3]|uniref:Zn-ribbon domain-containing OB-fold protein n=1 Tax=Haladaptatus sp. SPP-AMP-3 TaxID=3121295 RepID=UPI003C2B8A3E